MPFTSKLDAEFLPNTDKIILNELLIYYDPRTDKLITAPVNFITDGASIPKILWSVVGHPFSKKIRKAAIIHDYIYGNLLKYGYNRKDADLLFYDALIVNDVFWIKAKLFYYSVRWLGADHVKHIIKIDDR